MGLLIDKNKPKTCSEVFLIVDQDDLEKINGYNWNLKKSGSKSYVYAYGNKKQIYLHRLIMGFPEGCVDHINQNTLDNRKSNLRVCNKAENAWNSKTPKNNKSGFKGVCWKEKAKRWYSYICVNKKIIHLGVFSDRVSAAWAYNAAAVKYHGEFASLNAICDGGKI